jgi:uncharacterized protein (UPF0332 family)
MRFEEYEIAEIAAYNSAFHSARALLFAEDYTQRSHYCLNIALRHLYSKDDEILELSIILGTRNVSCYQGVREERIGLLYSAYRAVLFLWDRWGVLRRIRIA